MSLWTGITGIHGKEKHYEREREQKKQLSGKQGKSTNQKCVSYGGDNGCSAVAFGLRRLI